MHDVFISYSSANKNIADNMCHELESNGIRCWYAPRDIIPGRDWREAILEAIKSAKIFMLIYTKESNQSRQVLNEVSAAFDASCTIIPFRVDDVEMSSALSYYLNSVHWMDATNAPERKKIAEAVDFVKRILFKEVTENITTEPVKSPDKKRKNILPVVLISLLAVLVVTGGIITTIGLINNWEKEEYNVSSTPPVEETIPFMENPKAIEGARKSVVNLNVSINDMMVTSATGVACIENNIIVTSAAIFDSETLEYLGDMLNMENITTDDLEIHITSDDGLCIKIADILLLDYEANIAVLSTSGTHNIPLLPLADNSNLTEGSEMLAISYYQEIGDSVACESSCIKNSSMIDGIEYITFDGTQDLIYAGGALVNSDGKLVGICTASLDNSTTYLAISINEITDRLNSR